MASGLIKKVRVLILLYVLLMISGTAWLTKARTTDWDRALTVAIYPINGDNSKVTQDYIETLNFEIFKEIEDFFDREAKNYQLVLKKPIDIDLAPEIMDKPPAPPFGQSVLSVMYWSLKLRYWSWSRDNYKYPKDIMIFVLYFDPENNKSVSHSLGLQKGLVGIVNAFASEKMAAENNIVITHELLHTVGASDKYSPGTNQPIFPVGYAEPDLAPTLPQTKAEIMGGRIPITETKAEIPTGLDKTVLGEATALEIRWLTEHSND